MKTLKKHILLTITVLTSPVFSAPHAAGEATRTISPPQYTGASASRTVKHDTADGLRPTEPVKFVRDDARLQRRFAQPPDHLTIEITNSYGQDITTAHAWNPGSETPVGGIEPGVIPDGTTASFAVPTGWAGNVAFNREGMSINGDVTLIEGSFVVPELSDVAVVGVDVSHVNGFTVPITCECDGNWVSGCNKDLFDIAGYEADNAPNAEPNPLRHDLYADSATPFFAPCEGLAYTFPSDHGANSVGACQSGLISCCVGTACQASALHAQMSKGLNTTRAGQ